MSSPLRLSPAQVVDGDFADFDDFGGGYGDFGGDFGVLVRAHLHFSPRILL